MTNTLKSLYARCSNVQDYRPGIRIPHGEHVEKTIFEEVNQNLLAEGKKPAAAERSCSHNKLR